jgi:hypothetical protein
MTSRSNVTEDVLVAQLDGRARYHLQHKSTHAAALDDLRSIGAPPEIIRQAADSARTAYLADPAFRWQEGDVARLLDDLL